MTLLNLPNADKIFVFWRSFYFRFLFWHSTMYDPDEEAGTMYEGEGEEEEAEDEINPGNEL